MRRAVSSRRTTFSDFMDSEERISSNILTDRINKLRKYNLIEYRVHPNNRKIKQYYLTQAGIDLYPIIYDLIVWSIDHLDMEFDPIAVDWFKKNERLIQVYDFKISEIDKMPYKFV